MQNQQKPKGKPRGGSRKGCPNKTTRALKERINDLIDGVDLQQLAAKLTPKELADFIVKLLPYSIARVDSGVSVSTDNGGLCLIIEKVDPAD